MPPTFLSVDDVLALHESTIEVEGGSPGIRDLGLLESAVMMPQQQFGGEYLHASVAEQAAAYLFHLAQNHAFVDGNKRVAVLAALVFLSVNNATPLPPPEALEAVVLRVAASEMTKAELTEWLTAQLPE